MKHPTGPDIQAYIDGELPQGADTALARHIDACPRCKVLAGKMRSRAAAFSRAVLDVDRMEPARWDPPGARPGRLRTAWRSATPAFRWAAAVMLTVAGAAAALVGRDALTRQAGQTGGAEEVVQPAGGTPAAGVFMALLLDSAAIVVEGAGSATTVQVRTSGRRDVSVRVEGGADAPRFRVDEGTGRVLVDLGGGDVAVRVEVPASLRSGVVRVDGRVVVRITDGRVEPPEAAGAGVPIGSGSP